MHAAAPGAPVALSGTEPTEASAATDWAPVVADIRESYLGPPGEQARYATHTQRLGRAVQRLAAELYADDHHWVFELLQNADDNRYGAGATASLSITVDEDAVVVQNNEAGFRPEDLRAICDIGASSKVGDGERDYMFAILQDWVRLKFRFPIANSIL